MTSNNLKTFLLCWGTAMILLVGPFLDRYLHPDSFFLFPNTNDDALIHPAFIHKVAEGYTNGDPFIWEHRHDPASITSFFNFWFRVYAVVYNMGGSTAL